MNIILTKKIILNDCYLRFSNATLIVFFFFFPIAPFKLNYFYKKIEKKFVLLIKVTLLTNFTENINSVPS